MAWIREVLKVRQVGNSLVITLPKALNKLLRWKRGDRVMLKTTGDGNVEITREGGKAK